MVWIVESVHPEHKAAVDFLNWNLLESLRLYALEVSVIRIDESKPAFRFSVICAPAPESIVTGSAASTATRQKYKAFFQSLIDKLRKDHAFTNARAGQPQNWYAFTSENSRVFLYSVSFTRNGKLRVEVYIDMKDKVKNETLFSMLKDDKVDINHAFGNELSWEPLDKKRACRIAIYRDGDIDLDSEKVVELQDWAIAELLSFKRVFPARIADGLKKLKNEVPAAALDVI